MFNPHNSYDRPKVRPLWQLLLAEQTNFLPPLTCAEYRALLDFLIQLVAEGCDPSHISRRTRSRPRWRACMICGGARPLC